MSVTWHPGHSRCLPLMLIIRTWWCGVEFETICEIYVWQLWGPAGGDCVFLYLKWLRLNYKIDRSHFNGLMQGRLNSIANALEFRLSCTNPLICWMCELRNVHTPPAHVAAELVMPATANNESLKFGVQQGSGSNWFSQVNRCEITRVNCTTIAKSSNNGFSGWWIFKN